MATPLTQIDGTFDASTFVAKVIEPTLCHLTEVTYSMAAAQLLLGTALHESGGLQHNRQVGGPARSYFQIEPATHDDVWANFLDYRPKLAAQISSLLRADGLPKLDQLVDNPAYGAGIARICYLRAPKALPTFDDLNAQARYWKDNYNTVAGKGTTAKYLADWSAHGGASVVFQKSC